MFIITEGGTYRVYGTVQNGRIVGDTSKDAKVELIFDGASVTCSNYAPLYIKQVDKVMVSLADGTQNKLENDEDSTLGIYTQTGGTVTVYATDDAVHAVASLTVSSGSLKIEKCFEGLEAAKIYTKGGNVYVNAADDGINATAGADINCYNGEAIISISGGKTEIVT